MVFLLIVWGGSYSFIFRCIHFLPGLAFSGKGVLIVERYLAAYSCICHYEKGTAMDTDRKRRQLVFSGGVLSTVTCFLYLLFLGRTGVYPLCFGLFSTFHCFVSALARILGHSFLESSVVWESIFLLLFSAFTLLILIFLKIRALFLFRACSDVQRWP